jgi:hypothetical protein
MSDQARQLTHSRLNLILLCTYQSPMVQLYSHVLQHVFACLGLADLASIVHVSRLWHSAHRDMPLLSLSVHRFRPLPLGGSPVRRPNVEAVGKHVVRLLADTVGARWIVRNLPRLQTLVCNHIKFAMAPSKPSSLTEIHLELSRALLPTKWPARGAPDGGVDVSGLMQSLSQNCINLQTLHLHLRPDTHFRLCDKRKSIQAQMFPHLTTLSMGGISADIKHFDWWTLRCFPTLQVLAMHFFHNGPGDSLLFVECSDALQAMPSLRSVHIIHPVVDAASGLEAWFQARLPAIQPFRLVNDAVALSSR